MIMQTLNLYSRVELPDSPPNFMIQCILSLNTER